MTPEQIALNFESKKLAKLRAKAERACRINTRHLHPMDVLKIVGPRGEAAQDAFDRDVAMDAATDLDYDY